MPWDEATAIDLKNLIYKGKAQEFRTQFNHLIKTHTPPTIKDYLISKEDQGRNLLWHAANKKGNEEIIQYLIDVSKKFHVGDIVNQADKQGITPLWIAADSGYIGNVKILIDNNANVMAKNKEETLLHTVAKADAEEIIELLISEGAKVDAINKNGATPLHIAAERSIINIHALVKYGHEKIDLNAQDNKGNTPLHYSVIGQLPDNTEYLLWLGADRTVFNNNYTTASQMAREDEATKDNWKAISHFNPKIQSPEAAEEFYNHCIELVGDN